MPKYKKKPVVIEAEQWFKVTKYRVSEGHKDIYHLNVEPLYHPLGATERCPQCNDRWTAHGQLHTLEGDHIVCPGDYIITGVEGEQYACKPRIFLKTYERIEE